MSKHQLLEHQIILWSVCLDDARDAQMHDLLRGNIDWGVVHRLAATHSLLPLLYRRLKGLASGLVPVEILDSLKIFGVQNAVSNFRLLQRLQRMLTVLAEQGIPAVPVKGLVLAHQAYGDLSLRQLSDLDILLINPADLYPTYTTLCTAGYCAAEPIVPRMRQLANNMHFWDHDILFEIHWAMPEREYGCTLDGKSLASRMQQLSICGQTLPALSSEDTLLLHVLHGAKHQWNRLIWIADAAYLLRATPQLDWGELFAQVERLGVRRIFLTSLLLVQQLSGTTYPDKVQALCAADPVAQELVDYLRKTLFLNGTVAIAGFPHYMLRSRERLRDKLFYLTYPREGDQNVVRLPQVLFPLYYLIRPLRMLGKVASAKLAPRARPG